MHPALVVTGPGGMDKSMLVRQLVANYGDDFARPISHTTREPRKGEVHGVDYFFISAERMRTLIGRGLFAEHTEEDGVLYGTAHSAMKTVARSKRSCALAINVDGAQQLRESTPDGRFVFVAPQSMAALEAKLRARGTQVSDSSSSLGSRSCPPQPTPTRNPPPASSTRRPPRLRAPDRRRRGCARRCTAPARRWRCSS